MCQLTFLAIFSIIISGSIAQYDPNWESLDSRPLPKWYDDAKFGIFLHWGVYSVPSFGSEWFWSSWKGNDPAYIEYVNKFYPKTFSYQEFAKDFKAEFFDPNEWADIFADSGAKYVVLTSKHHEGYTLWPSKYSYSWNAGDIGSGRDLLGEVATAVRSKNLTFGIYYSLYEWFNPLYLSDKATNFVQREYVDHKAIPELTQLIETYKPSVIWSDGDWEASHAYWNSTSFLAWLYSESPVKDVVITNDRWGNDNVSCNHGDFYTCADRYNPGTLQPHKWENAMTLDKVSWGFRRNAKLSDYFTTPELLTQLVSTVSCGGNLLLNVGPTKDGIIAPIFQLRLKELGEWLSINGEAIYGSKPWTVQNDTLTEGVWYTSKDSSIYVITLSWPSNNTLTIASAAELFKNTNTVVTLLGNKADESLKWSVNNGIISIQFPDLVQVKSKFSYVLKITSVQ